MASLTHYVQKYLTDPLGLTDRNAGRRAQDAMNAGQKHGDEQLDSDLSDSFNALRSASAGRDFGGLLDDYDQTMQDAQNSMATAGGIALDQVGAGSADNVEKYLNPMMDQMLARTNQAMQGNAGASLQSSATNKNISNAVANQAGQLWQQAFGNAMGDAGNNLNAATNFGKSATSTAGLAGQQLTADMQPMEDLLSLQNDRAMQRYAANTGMTQANMQLAGQKQTLL